MGGAGTVGYHRKGGRRMETPQSDLIPVNLRIFRGKAVGGTGVPLGSIDS